MVFEIDKAKSLTLKCDRIAFLINPENFRMVIGNGWHLELAREKGISLNDYRYGGYISRDMEFIPVTGTVANPPESLWEVLKSDLQEFLGAEIKMYQERPYSW